MVEGPRAKGTKGTKGNKGTKNTKGDFANPFGQQAGLARLHHAHCNIGFTPEQVADLIA